MHAGGCRFESGRLHFSIILIWPALFWPSLFWPSLFDHSDLIILILPKLLSTLIWHSLAPAVGRDDADGWYQPHPQLFQAPLRTTSSMKQASHLAKTSEARGDCHIDSSSRTGNTRLQDWSRRHSPLRNGSHCRHCRMSVRIHAGRQK